MIGFRFFGFALFAFIFLSCGNNKTLREEKTQPDRSVVVDISNNIIDIETEIIFGNSMLYVLDKYLLIQELKPSKEKGIHIFDKNTFKYVTSAGIIGQGPGEIARPGKIGIDDKNRILWVPDHGKKLLYKFPLDSMIASPDFKPSESIALNLELFLERFGFLNDSIAIGKAVHIGSNNTFEMMMGRLNLSRNETKKFGYEHPDAIEKMSNSHFRLSHKNGLYVNCYAFCDLMTICDLDGNLKWNVYGEDGLENKDFKKTYFTAVDFFNNLIIASYVGDLAVVTNQYKRLEGNLPSKFLIFDTDGNYQKTIETGSKFTFFCVDEANHRVITYFSDREHPLAYFNL
jgi:hypothetical protein